MEKTSTACCFAKGSVLKATDTHVNAFKALAHKDRLRVFFYLVRTNTPVAANVIQRALKLPGPTLSHHLDSLEQSGLIERRRQERFIFSSVRHDLVVELVRLLTACC